MDVEILARLQFALTIMFHYLYPPLSIGIGLLLVLFEGLYLKTGNEEWKEVAKFWTRLFALTFAIGVATGIVMEFEFGTNWASYSRYVGDIFGSALAAEGIFAFFLESGFLAILLFGWERVGPKMHFFSTCMLALGAHFSAVWIIVANSWMQTPAGFHINGEGMFARAEVTDFWAMVFNPSSMTRLAHVIIGCWLAGAFLLLGIAAYYLLKKQHLSFAKKSAKIALIIAVIAVILQLFSGGKGIARYQPSKLAVLEGVFKTKSHAPLTLIGIPNVSEEKIDYQVAIPDLLSYLAFSSTDAEVIGLDRFPKKDWPHVQTVFVTYRLMAGMWVLMLISVVAVLYKLWRGSLWECRWVLKLLVASFFFPQIANQTGWVSAEMGRYPWIVQDLLSISEALSVTIKVGHVLGSIIMFSTVYAFLFALFLYLLVEKIKKGRGPDGEETQYHHLQEYVEEVTNGSR